MPWRFVDAIALAVAMIRLFVSLALFSTWLVLLLLGSPLVIYLLLVAALAIFPWRLLRLDDDGHA